MRRYKTAKAAAWHELDARKEPALDASEGHDADVAGFVVEQGSDMNAVLLGDRYTDPSLRMIA